MAYAAGGGEPTASGATAVAAAAAAGSAERAPLLIDTVHFDDGEREAANDDDHPARIRLCIEGDVVAVERVRVQAFDVGGTGNLIGMNGRDTCAVVSQRTDFHWGRGGSMMNYRSWSNDDRPLDITALRILIRVLLKCGDDSHTDAGGVQIFLYDPPSR